MRIDFDEKNHIYRIDGDIASISVTELLHKHGLAPDYSGVSKATLKKASDKGKAIHKDIETFLKAKDYVVETKQGKEFQSWAEENLDCAAAEQMFAGDFNGILIAGTADVIGFLKDGTPFIADHKTTAKFDRDYVTWQCSLLDYIARQCSNRVINGRLFKWQGAKKLLCFHYGADGMEVKELTAKSDEELKELLEAEAHDRIYQRKELTVSDEMRAEIAAVETELVRMKEAYDREKKHADEVRAALVKEMERQGVYSFETDNVKITYIAPFDRMTVDSTRLRRDFPQIYAECVKPTAVKASVRVTIKGEEK